jgi:hypothetical protein
MKHISLVYTESSRKRGVKLPHINLSHTHPIIYLKRVVNGCTQNPFEVNLTIVGVKIRHDYKWDYDTLVKICMGLSQASLFSVVITPFIVKPYFNPNKSELPKMGYGCGQERTGNITRWETSHGALVWGPLR